MSRYQGPGRLTRPCPLFVSLHFSSQPTLCEISSIRWFKINMSKTPFVHTHTPLSQMPDTETSSATAIDAQMYRLIGAVICPKAPLSKGALTQSLECVQMRIAVAPPRPEAHQVVPAHFTGDRCPTCVSVVTRIADRRASFLLSVACAVRVSLPTPTSAHWLVVLLA